MYSKLFTGIIAGAVGAIIGATVTHVYEQKRYSQLVEEEIEKTKTLYCQEKDKEPKAVMLDLTKDEVTVKSMPQDKKDYGNVLANAGYLSKPSYADYTQYSKPEQNTTPVTETDISNDVPILIAPEIYGQLEDYDMQELVYYKDGVITDEDGDILELEKVKELVGSDFASHFGDYDDNSIYVMNDTNKTYYQVIAEPFNYGD